MEEKQIKNAKDGGRIPQREMQEMPTPTQLPRVAVVILNWNGVHFLEQFLPSVLKSTYPKIEIYVADNGSTDNSVSYLQIHFPSVKVIELPENYGFAKGYNEALKQVEADYFVLLNSDVEVSPKWVEPVIKLMETDPYMAACQPKILAYHNKTQFEYAGAAGGWIDKFGYPFCRGRFFDVCEADDGQYNNVSPIFWASGAALFIKAKVYQELQGLDSDFFAHMEEIDLCWRIHRAGYHIMYCPKSVVYHVGGGTLQKTNPRKTFLNFRNNLALLYKNLPTSRLLPTLFIRAIFDSIAFVRFLVTGDFKNAWAVLNAVFSFYIKLPMWQRKRSAFKRLLKTTQVKDTPSNIKTGVYQGSIIVQRFLKGKKYFSDIVKTEIEG